MKNKLLIPLYILIFTAFAIGQQVSFEAYDLDNGLHVILHQDNTVPVVATAVMYHVGSKDEDPERTGFAHFFEHLLFEGTKNIARGDWFKIVSSNGGTNNANTTQDRTYYFELFPSNNLELGLWMESERMLHPVINEIGVETQNEVVKEEKRQNYDNRAYGQWIREVFKNLFKKHPYRWTVIGSMEHLDAATLDEFIAFNKKYYVPNNAVLVVAGDIDVPKTKKMVKDYFGSIPAGEPIEHIFLMEDEITKEIEASFEDPNIQIPEVFIAYKTPSMITRDARVLDMISSILSDGKSARLYKKLVDDEKKALQVTAFNYALEDYGAYIVLALPLGENTLDDLVNAIDEEIIDLQDNLISERDLQKLHNKFENNFINANSSIGGIAHSLAKYYLLYDDTNLINTEIDIYNSITREEIRAVAKKYLKPNKRLVLDYLPETVKN